MSYSELLADRVRQILSRGKIAFHEKKMMGGLTFMVDDKMCVGVLKETLMARVDPHIYDESLQRPGARPMDFTKRPMRGFVFVEDEGIDLDEDLEYWIQLALEFNPRAKSSKKKKKI